MTVYEGIFDDLLARMAEYQPHRTIFAMKARDL